MDKYVKKKRYFWENYLSECNAEISYYISILTSYFDKLQYQHLCEDVILHMLWKSMDNSVENSCTVLAHSVYLHFKLYLGGILAFSCWKDIL